jgi:hypothetical protein
MQDRSKEGLGYLAVSLLPAAIAVEIKHPVIKLVAALCAIGLISKAGECFQDTAKQAFYQLKLSRNNQLLQ